MGKNVVVVGTQWGDEGKGKIVDLLTDRAAAWATCLGVMRCFNLASMIDLSDYRLVESACPQGR